MRWLVPLVVLIASSAFLYRQYQEMKAPPSAPAPAAPPVLALPEPQPLLTEAELKRVRASAADPDPEVRWTAIQLLVQLKDPKSADILEKVIASDLDSDLRMRAVKLLQQEGGGRKLPGLLAALDDADNDVRSSALKAIGELADPAAAPRVAALLKDPDPDIRSEALRTLGRFQEKRMRDFQELSEQLRRQYEDAVKKAKEHAQQQ